VDVRDATETLRHAGWYGVLLFNFMFTMGQLMRMPGFIFLIIGGITYGRVYGFVVNILALPVVLGVQFVIYRKCVRPPSLAAFLRPAQPPSSHTAVGGRAQNWAPGGAGVLRSGEGGRRVGCALTAAGGGVLDSSAVGHRSENTS
jgi:hypothetical protein